MLLRQGTKWGVWTYNPSNSQTAFHLVGDGIKYAAPLSTDEAAFVEKTDYGSYTAGMVDIATGARTDAVEAPTLWKMIDAKRPPVAEAARDGGTNELANLVTGSVLDLPDGASVRRSNAGVLVWVGGRRPIRAWLYEPNTWKPLAWWRAASKPRSP
jgi:hypothetical protein